MIATTSLHCGQLRVRVTDNYTRGILPFTILKSVKWIKKIIVHLCQVWRLHMQTRSILKNVYAKKLTNVYVL
jgi:hypothetical protein